MRRQGPLGGDDRGDGVGGSGEDDKKGVTGSADLAAAGVLEGGAQVAVVLSEDARVAVTEVLKETCRTFDIGEQQCDGPRWEIGHAPLSSRVLAIPSQAQA